VHTPTSGADPVSGGGGPPAYRAMSFSLETPRLALRLRTGADATWNLELLAEHDGGTTLTLDEAERRLVEQNENARKTGIGLLTIRRRVEGDPIGYCGVIVGRGTFDEPEIAYELLPRFRGYGYATEAAGAVAHAAFATGRPRLWASVGSWNTASLRVLEKVGFHRDHSVADERGEIVFMVRSAPETHHRG
jgi:RimJ/RimL family protein N-acetyltransferase